MDTILTIHIQVRGRSPSLLASEKDSRATAPRTGEIV
jgi:hypothetical protein